MAEKRKKGKRKEEVEPEKPSKEDYAIAKYVRFNCPTKKSTLFGQKVDYFIASKAVDCLLDSKWAVNTKKKEALFTTRDSVVTYMNKLIKCECFFHRAAKLVKTVAIKKKKKKDDEEKKGGEKESPSKKKKKDDEEKKGGEKESPSKKKKEEVDKNVEQEKAEPDISADEMKKPENKDEKSKPEKEDEDEKETIKEKKKVKLEPHDEQIFVDGNEVYVWTYDPVSTKTFLIGLLVLLGAVAVCLFPLWPPEIRSGVYYLSLTGIGLIGALLGLSLFRYILYGFIWTLTLGKLHFWLFPNLDADCGFKESFMPAYEYEFKGGTNTPSDNSSKDKEVSGGKEGGSGRKKSNSGEEDDGGDDGAENARVDDKDGENDEDFEVIEESEVVDESGREDVSADPGDTSEADKGNKASATDDEPLAEGAAA